MNPPADANLNTPTSVSLRSNFVWTFTGNAVYAGCQWAIVAVTAKMGNTVLVGQLAFALAVTAPIQLLSNMELRAVQATDAIQKFSFRDYVSLRLLTTLLAVLIYVVVAFCTDAKTGVIVLFLGLAKAIESISDVFYGALQRHEEMRIISISMIAKGLLSVITFAAVFYLKHSLPFSVAALCLAWLVILLAYDMPNHPLVLRRFQRSLVLDSVRPHWHKRIFTSLALLTLPLGFVTALVSVGANIPRYFIKHLSGEHDLGIFAALAYVTVAGSMVVNALGQSACPRLANKFASGDPEFRRLLWKLTGMGALLGLTGTAIALEAGGPILTLLYRVEYANYSDVFVLLMISATFSYVAAFFGYGLTAAGYFRTQIPMAVCSIIVTAAGCLFLIPRYGLKGAAFGLMLGAITQMAISGSIILFITRD